MKIKEGFVLREVAGKNMVIATGEASKEFHGMIVLNDTGREVWSGLQNGDEIETIIERISEKYDEKKEKIEQDVLRLTEQMQKAGFLEL